ncbi:MAG: CopG family transcriptional regulator [Deltaproteobacteria bacterium]|nr:CopG family transcriptional regulator [Deltaproteobacteria bacterium]
MSSAKSALVSFKVDPALAEALARMPNRSAFIRTAILAALDNTCPLCGGSGVLSVAQQTHWDQLQQGHHIETCETCHEPHLVCNHEEHHHHEG